MVQHEYVKHESLRLSDAEHDEKWLQTKISEDPSILGLGDLRVIQRERRQSSGGKIDFLMVDDETEFMYEVEIMLGSLDESHIIRTIEYWDIERRRWPSRQHRAVIVAEEITNRFFNVIFLFTRVIPIIVIQLNVLRVSGQLLLNFTKILDVWEEPIYEEEAEPERVNRSYWEAQWTAVALSVVDRLISLATTGEQPRVTYNKHHIAMGGPRLNYCWFHPRKAPGRWVIELRVPASSAQQMLDRLQQSRFEARLLGENYIRFVLTPDLAENNEQLLRDMLQQCMKEVGGAAS